MKQVVKLSLLSGLLFHSISYAGLNKTTAHSRANCINNESITWFAQRSFNWRVVSVHGKIGNPYNHGIDTGWAITWRQAAVHWGEGKPFGKKIWGVTGYHFFSGYAEGKIPFETTIVTDCSIYDGWWD